MNRFFIIAIGAAILGSVFFFSCATIVGGTHYYASVVVNGNPKATITAEGRGVIGTGIAKTKISRWNSDKVIFKVKAEGCKEQVFRYISKNVRLPRMALGNGVVGVEVGWYWYNYLLSGYYGRGKLPSFPFGVVLGTTALLSLVDFATGAAFEPNAFEAGVSKLDYKNFQYILNYTGCD